MIKKTMKEIREKLKIDYDIEVVFSRKRYGVNVYRVFSKTHSLNSMEYSKEELIRKWLLQ